MITCWNEGYEFEVIKGYFHKEKGNPFREFIDVLFEKKKEAKLRGKMAMSFVVKILMNSFYGKFGQRRFFDKIGIFLEGDKVTLGKEKEQEEVRTPYTSVHVASLITAYSRRELNVQMEKLQKSGIESLLLRHGFNNY